MPGKSLTTGLLRGFSRRCPNCGKAKLFEGYLSVRSPCPFCGIDNTAYPSDDLPPYLTIAVVGHVVIPLFMWQDHRYSPDLWLQAAIWLPLTAILTLVLLPRMKGAAIGVCWAMDILRQNIRTPRS